MPNNALAVYSDCMSQSDAVWRFRNRMHGLLLLVAKVKPWLLRVHGPLSEAHAHKQKNPSIRRTELSNLDQWNVRICIPLSSGNGNGRQQP